MNWTVEETQVLLCAWSDERVQKSLAENLRNRHVFKHLSARMSDMGFSRSPHQCRLRVKTLKANYVRAKVLKSVDSSQPCGFRYYAEMEAVLGRKAIVGVGEGSLGSVTESGGCHLGIYGGKEVRHFDYVPDTLEGDLGAHALGNLVTEIKVEEDREVSTDEFEFRNEGPTHTPTPRRDRIILQDSFIHSRPIVAPTKYDLSSEPPSPLPSPPPPLPASPVPPVPEPNHSTGPAPSNHSLSPSHSLELALKHLADCFQGLVSESRGLLVQLESQRQEQAHWHQELLAQWLEREDRRQREAAEREERREKARMEHEIRVLQLLTGLAQQRSHPRCKCNRPETAGEVSANKRLTAENRDESDSDAL